MTTLQHLTGALLLLVAMLCGLVFMAGACGFLAGVAVRAFRFALGG